MLTRMTHNFPLIFTNSHFYSISHIFSDSIENQEGGAMYISCGDDGAGVESEMGYVPNNPLFGLPLDSPQVNFESLTSTYP